MDDTKESTKELLQNKLKKLERDRIITADPARQFELDEQIKETSQKIANFDNKYNQVYQSLLSLNYEKQVDIYKKFWEGEPKPQVGSFLVLGKPKQGQRWLVNKLLHLKALPNTTEVKKVPISFALDDIYIEDLCSRLKSVFNCSSKPEEVVKSIYKHWQKRTVILVIHNLNRLDSNERYKIMEQLWCPLVEMIQNCTQPCNSNLLMFLVDNKFSNDSIDYIDLLQKWQFPQSVIMQLDNFSEDILSSWILNNQALLNLTDGTEDVQKLSKEFLENGYGLPEIVMDEICQYCDYSWSEVSKQLAV